MVVIMMHQHHQTSLSSTQRNPTPIQSQQPPRLALDHATPPFSAVQVSTEPPLMLGRVRLSDIVPYDGAPCDAYVKSVEALSDSLMRYNAAVIELGSEDTSIMRCGLEAARAFFRSRAAARVGGRGVCMYRAGKLVEDCDLSPPCMGEVFRCMGKAARASLSAIGRHLRLRSDVFNHLLDDTPLPTTKVSSSVLLATHSHSSLQNGKDAIAGGKVGANGEVEKGLLTLISSDSPGLQVCDPNGRWYLAECGSAPGDLLLITGKALSHTTAGLRPAASYRIASGHSSSNNSGGRTSLVFRLIPRSNAILDCSAITAAGHIIPQSYVPISVSQFMDDLSADDDVMRQGPDSNHALVAGNNLSKEPPSLRSVLSDPLSGQFLEDAVVVSCGHSFGGLLLRRVLDNSRCTVCGAEIEAGSLVPNLALRAAAAAIKHEDDRRLFHNAALRKRRKEMSDQTDLLRRPDRENGERTPDDGSHKGVQYPFAVNEKVVIKGNRRTPEKFVGKEAIITSQCLNGWYLLKIIGSGENVRLQYRSLRRILSSQPIEDRCSSQPIQSSNL